MLQAAFPDCLLLDLFSHLQDFCAKAEIDVARGDAAEDVPGTTAGLIGGDVPVASNDGPPVRRFPPAVAGTVIDKVRVQSRRLNADTESSDPVVPLGVGFRLWTERLDGARGEGHPYALDALSGLLC